MDLTKLSMGDKVIAGSGIVLFIASFFNWLGAKVDIGPQTISEAKGAWSFTLTLFAVLIGIAMVAVVVLKAADVKLPSLGGTSWGQALLIAGAIALAFVVIKIITGAGGLPDGVDKTRKIGIFIGLIATGGLTYGGYLRMNEDKAGGGSTPPTA